MNSQLLSDLSLHLPLPLEPDGWEGVVATPVSMAP